MEENGRDNSGRFSPGHKGFKKPKTEIQRLTKTKLSDFLQEKLEDLPAIYEELKPRDKARLLLYVIEFFLPKQREHVIEIENGLLSRVDLTHLSATALEEILLLDQKTSE